MEASYLVAVHHEVVGGDKGFEDHHPAGVGRALEQRVCQLGNVHVHLIGAVNQIWQRGEREREREREEAHKELHNRRKQKSSNEKSF